ncbi:MAG: hypothetical protein V3S21_05245 [Xanthomonadales bacterium]
MSYMRLAAIGTVSLLMAAACSKTENTVEMALETTDNILFDYVPSATPYLAGNLKPTPDEVIEAFLQRLAPVLESVQSELDKARQTLENQAAAHDEDDSSLLNAVLQELDGKFSRQGMESLGFDLRSHKVVYGMGVFPVLRIGLSDADALRATIQRVLANAGINAAELEHQGISYWQLSDGDTADQPVGIYVAIFDDHLAMSIFPPMAETELLPAFLGLDMPGDSNAATRLAELNAKHAYTSYGSGILDFGRLIEKFISPDTLIARVLAINSSFDPAEMTPECITEIRSIVSNWPRMTVGIRELTTSAIALQYRVETKPTLARQIAGLVAAVPVANPLSDRILEFSFGMRFGAVRDFLREKAAAIMENPYRCEHLQSINESATEAFTQLNRPMPPLVNNFRGLRLSLSEITETNSMPVNGRGLIAVHVDQPELFVGMARMFLPDLSELTLAPGEPPVQLPVSLLPMTDVVAFAALSAEAIGLSIGDGEQARLLPYLAEEAGPAGTFMSIGYDMTAYLEYAEHLTPFASTSAQQAVQSFFGRSYTSFRFTPEGFEADSRMAFK